MTRLTVSSVMSELSIGFVRLCGMGVKRWAVEIGAADRAQLEAWLRTQSIAQALAMRAAHRAGQRGRRKHPHPCATAAAHRAHHVPVATSLREPGFGRLAQSATGWAGVTPIQ